jgi:TonB family protein
VEVSEGRVTALLPEYHRRKDLLSMDNPMRCLRLCCFLLPLAALPALSQAPVATPLAANGSGVPGPVENAPVHIGGAVAPPRVIYSVDPESTYDARRAGVRGNVQVYLWVDKNGNASHVRVVKPIGYGLDEKAVEAVRQYKFKPATRNGEPVVVELYIDVNFQVF